MSLEALSGSFDFRALCRPTGCGRTRVPRELRWQGEQILELEELTNHRGSPLGALPGQRQAPQKMFDSLQLEVMRKLDLEGVVWLEAESKMIGNLQLPERLWRCTACR